MTEIIKPILHVLAIHIFCWKHCISILFLSEPSPNKEIPAVVTSEIWMLFLQIFFTADKNCCWLDRGDRKGGQKLIPDLEFREGATNPSATPTSVILKCILSTLRNSFSFRKRHSQSVKLPRIEWKKGKIAQSISRKWKLARRGFSFYFRAIEIVSGLNINWT